MNDVPNPVFKLLKIFSVTRQIIRGLVGLLVAALVLTILTIHWSNSEIELRNQMIAQKSLIRLCRGDELFEAQRKLIDLKRRHDDLRYGFPSSIICGSRDEVIIE